MGLLTNSCNHCGAINSKLAQHCICCRQPSSQACTWCLNCGAEGCDDSEYCRRCGALNQDQPKCLLVGDRLRLPPGCFATHVSIRMPERTLHHGLHVDNGTLALLKISGETNGLLLQPRFHAFDAINDRLKPSNNECNTLEATLFVNGTTRITCPSITGQDRNGLTAQAACQVLVQVGSAIDFDRQHMLNRDALTEADLLEFIQPFMSQAIRDELRERDAVQLDRDNSQRQFMMRSLADRLAIMLSNNGLSITQVFLISFGGDALTDIQRLRSDVAHCAETKRIEQDAAVIKNDSKRFQAQMEHDLSEQLKALSHDARLSDLDREKFAELHRLANEGVQGAARSEHKIAEIRRRVAEIQEEARLKVAITSGNEDVVDEQLRRKLARDETKVNAALRLRNIAAQHFLSNAPTTGIQPGRTATEAQRLDHVMSLLRSIESGYLGSSMPSLSSVATGESASISQFQFTPSTPPTLADAIRPYRRSVGVVVAVHLNGSLSPIGTAWAWRGNRNIFAATNAHVADEAQMWRDQGAIIEWRLSGSCGSGHVVEKWKVHPLYGKPGSVQCGGPNGNFPSHDVALLKLQENCANGLTPLPIVSGMELRSLQEGPAAGWTCAGEELVGIDLIEPQAGYHAGNICAQTDFLFKPIKPRSEPQLIHHTLPTIGGNSGSPLLAIVGGSARVVGVFCAGNMHTDIARVENNPYTGGQTITAVRLPSSAQRNFAQAVTLLRSVPEPDH